MITGLERRRVIIENATLRHAAPIPPIGIQEYNKDDYDCIVIQNQLMPITGTPATKTRPTERQIELVQNSMLFSQLVANNAADLHADAGTWYGTYTKYMGMCGWVMTGMDFEEHKSSSASFTVADVLVDILKSIYSPGDIKLALRMFDAFRHLDEKNKAHQVFGYSSVTANTCGFQATPIRLNDNGLVHVGLATFLANTAHSETDVFAIQFKTATDYIRTVIEGITLDETIAEAVAADVKDRIIDTAKDSIAHAKLPKTA